MTSAHGLGPAPNQQSNEGPASGPLSSHAPTSSAPTNESTLATHEGFRPHHAPQTLPRQDVYDASPVTEHAPPPPKPSEHQQAADQAAGSSTGKASWTSKLAGWGTKAAAPFNALANKVGAETFLPTTMDRECEKAARIIRGFCKDGIYADPAPQTVNTGKDQSVSQGADTHKAGEAATVKKSRALVTIPSKVISRAEGVAIFTTVRAGFHVSGASGSGVLIARRPDGGWSPPSGIQVHSLGAGLVMGLDIYDCVIVINTKEALQAFMRTRMSLGSDLAVAAGPWGAGGSLDWGMPAQKDKSNGPALPPRPGQQAEQASLAGNQAPAQGSTSMPSAPATSKHQHSPAGFRDRIGKPVYSYVKSKGFYAGMQIDGTVVTERKDANAAFYGAPVPVESILKGEVAPGPWSTYVTALSDVLKGAEGWRGHESWASTTLPVAEVTSGLPPPGPAGTPGLPAGPPGPPAASDVAAHGYGHTFPPPPLGPPPYMTDAKVAEAAHAAPENYDGPTTNQDLPPAYEDDGRRRPGLGDTKTAR